MDINYNMNKTVLLLSILFCLIVTVSARLEMVAEICRHGSRVPQRDTFGTKYSNGLGMPTPSGLRQHYLLGIELRRRYMKGYPNVHQLVDPVFDPNEAHVRSTQTARTVQSVYSQLLGLFPVGIADELEPELADVAIPLIKLPNLDSVVDSLGSEAIKAGMQPVSVRNFHRDVDRFLVGEKAFGDCPYMSNDFIRRSEDPEVWKELDEQFRPIIFNQIAQAFGLNSNDLKFMNILDRLEALYTEEFEGKLTRFDFTEEEWKIVRSMQVPHLLNHLSPTSSQIMAIRHLNPIRELMRSRMGRDFNETLAGDFNNAKLLVLSSHAYQMSHVINALAAENLELDHIDFASTLIFELHRKDSSGCETSTSESCFSVKIFYNDLQLKLPSCRNIDCTFKEFLRHLNNLDVTEDAMHELCFSEDLLTGYGEVTNLD